MLLQDLMEGLSLHKLHRDVSNPARFAQIKNANYIPIRDLPSQDEFLLEALKNFRVAGQFRPDNFDSNYAVEFEVLRLVNRTHTAFAENLQNLVAVSNDGAGLKDGGGKRAGGRRCILSP